MIFYYKIYMRMVSGELLISGLFLTLKKQETVGGIKNNPILGTHRVPFWDCCCF